MSHLVENVEGNKLNTASLNDFGGLSVSSPSNNQYLEYNSTSGEWEPATKSISTGEKYIYSFFTPTGSSWHWGSGSGYRYEADSNLTSIREQMQAPFTAGTSTELKNTGITRYDWGQFEWWYNSSYPRFSGCFVPSGTYLCRAIFSGYPSSSAGYAKVRWATGPASGTIPSTSSLTPVGPYFYTANRTGRFAQVPTAIIRTTNTSTLLTLEFMEGSNYERGNASEFMKYVSFHIIKI